MVPDIHKAIAIEKVLAHLNIPRENTFGFGDGNNDIEMLEYCNTGVAMGNAREELKAVADDITDDVDHDGLYNSFKKYHLI
ncbi:Sugar phosphatase YbiV [compost metagenome]